MIRDFKFFQKPKSETIGSNQYNGFDMDRCVLAVLRYKQIVNEQITNTRTYFTDINVPIVNSWITITTWRTMEATVHLNERTEIDYSVYSTDNTPMFFTFVMDTMELLNHVNVERF